MHIHLHAHTQVLAHTCTHMHTHTCMYTCLHTSMLAPLGLGLLRLEVRPAGLSGAPVGPLHSDHPAAPPGLQGRAHMPGSGGEQHLLLDIRCLCLEMNIILDDRPHGAPPGQSPLQARTCPLARAGFGAGRGAARRQEFPAQAPCQVWPEGPGSHLGSRAAISSPAPGGRVNPQAWGAARPCLTSSQHLPTIPSDQRDVCGYLLITPLRRAVCGGLSGGGKGPWRL